MTAYELKILYNELDDAKTVHELFEPIVADHGFDAFATITEGREDSVTIFTFGEKIDIDELSGALAVDTGAIILSANEYDISEDELSKHLGLVTDFDRPEDYRGYHLDDRISHNDTKHGDELPKDLSSWDANN